MARRDPDAAWPLIPHFPANGFTGTAPYYDAYRVPYPRELIEHLRMRADITGNGRLLDLACGSGQVALAMYPFFREVLAVDWEPEMVAVGRERAERIGAANVRWAVGRAEDLDEASNSYELITVGNAFHRLDRRLIAKRALEWLPAGRFLATLGSSTVWTGEEKWQAVAVEVIRKWTTSVSNAVRTSANQPGQTHQQVLRDGGFEAVEQYQFPTRYVWTLESFIGFLYSTSVCSKAALGESAEEFEADLRDALLSYDSKGQYAETIDFSYILARRGE